MTALFIFRRALRELREVRVHIGSEDDVESGSPIIAGTALRLAVAHVHMGLRRVVTSSTVYGEGAAKLHAGHHGHERHARWSCLRDTEGYLRRYGVVTVAVWTQRASCAISKVWSLRSETITRWRMR